MDEYFARLCAEAPQEWFDLPEGDEYLDTDYYNVQWNPELWDLNMLKRLVSQDEKWRMLPQSMGGINNVKRNPPKNGDLVDFILTRSGKRRVVAYGIVHSGFEEGDIHRGHPCNKLGPHGERKHERTPAFCWVEILAFVENGKKIPFVSVPTWHEY
jgi:hypothetical protein